MIGYSKTQQVGPKKKSQTEKNQVANKQLKKEYDKRGVNYCEAKVSKNCMPVEIVSYGKLLKHTKAHRHKRTWYKEPGHEKLLGSYDQTIEACVPCHMAMEVDPELTERLFTTLRGPEKL